MKRRRTSGPSYAQLRSALVIEKKFYDYPLPKPTGTTNQQKFAVGNFLNDALVKCPLLDLTQGTNENQRVGRKIAVHSFHMYGALQLNDSPGVSPTNQWVRCIIFVDTQNNGVTTTDITELFDSNVTAQKSMYYFRDLTRGSRFQVLKDEFIELDSETVFNSNTNVKDVVSKYKFIEYHKTFNPPLKVEYNGTNGSGSELTQNNLYVAFLKFNTTIDVEFTGVSRIRFTD